MWKLLLYGIFVFKGVCSDQVLISADRSIYLVDTDNGSVTEVMTTSSPVYSMDYHYVKGYFYYAHDGSILRRSVNFTASEKPKEIFSYSPERYVNSIAVDWIHNIVFWTIGLGIEVHMSRLDGSRSRAIIKSGDIPRLAHKSDIVYLDNILVDPYHNVMLMLAEEKTADFQRKVIVKADLHGKNVTTILVLKFKSASSISIDVHRQRLYAAGSLAGRGVGFVLSSDYEGKNVKTIIKEFKELVYPINVFENILYAIAHQLERKSQNLYKMSISSNDHSLNSLNSGNSWSREFIPESIAPLTFTYVYDMKVYDKGAQISLMDLGLRHCKQKDCSDQCVVLPTAGATCVCQAGEEISADGNTCKVDEDVQLLWCDSMGVTKINVRSNSSITLNGTTGALVIDYHYFHDYIFYFNESDNKIYRNTLTNLGEANPIVSSDIEEVFGIAVDWVHDKIFWSNNLNGELEVADLDGSNRRVLITTTDGLNIKDIVIDPYASLLFMIDETDDGVGKIIRSNTKGEGVLRLIRKDEESVSCLAIDIKEKRIYFSIEDVILSSTYSFTEVTFTVNKFLKTVNIMRVYRGTLYLVVNGDNNSSILYKSRTDIGDKLSLKVLAIRAGNFTDLRVYIPTAQFSSDDQACLDMSCSHVCEVLPPSLVTFFQRVACVCPDDLHLEADGVTCTDIPKNKEPNNHQLIPQSTSPVLWLVLAVLVIVSLVSLGCCLWTRYGLSVGRHRWDYNQDWWRFWAASEDVVVIGKTVT